MRSRVIILNEINLASDIRILSFLIIGISAITGIAADI
jgi:hypothetical protein